MNDLTAVGVFFACLISTLGLVRACDWLRPQEHARQESGTSVQRKESRQ
jgi:hypothetical protein